jgi:hypothetical protein
MKPNKVGKKKKQHPLKSRADLYMFVAGILLLAGITLSFTTKTFTPVYSVTQNDLESHIFTHIQRNSFQSVSRDNPGPGTLVYQIHKDASGAWTFGITGPLINSDLLGDVEGETSIMWYSNPNVEVRSYDLNTV